MASRNEASIWASVNSAKKTDDNVIFPLTISEEGLVKTDLSAIEHLRIVRETQLAYVRTGANEQARCQHNVSCTVYVREEEWQKVTAYIALVADASTFSQ